MTVTVERRIEVLRNRLRNLVRQKRDIDGAERRERVKARKAERRAKLLNTIKTFGGRKAFIARYGQGLLIEQWRPEGCCTVGSVTQWWKPACEYLKVKPNLVITGCSFPAKHEVGAHKLCGVHLRGARQTVNRGLILCEPTIAELLEEWKDYGPLVQKKGYEC